jgi:hypothetical protein
MDNQLDMFKEYKGKLDSIAGTQRAAHIVSTSLYLVVTGTDDLANTYFTTPFRRDYDLESYIEYVVQCATDFIKVTTDRPIKHVYSTTWWPCMSLTVWVDLGRNCTARARGG